MTQPIAFDPIRLPPEAQALRTAFRGFLKEEIDEYLIQIQR